MFCRKLFLLSKFSIENCFVVEIFNRNCYRNVLQKVYCIIEIFYRKFFSVIEIISFFCYRTFLQKTFCVIEIFNKKLFVIEISYRKLFLLSKFPIENCFCYRNFLQKIVSLLKFSIESFLLSKFPIEIFCHRNFLQKTFCIVEIFNRKLFVLSITC